MPCPDCSSSSPVVFNMQSFVNSQCDSCNDCLSSFYVCYQGANLECSGILTGDTLETALTKIDEQICSAIGDYSTYQMHCLPDYYGEAITEESQFVDAISSYACTIAENLQTFTGVEFPQYQSEVEAQLATIDGPSLVCTAANVLITDNLATILAKYCSKFTEIDDELDMSDVDFGDCFSVVGTINTVQEAFNEVLSQICQVKAIAESGGGALPTFNNVGSCLATPTTTDSLEDTVIKIRTKLCDIDSSFDGTDIDWGCNDPDGDSLQEAIQNVATITNTLTVGAITDFSADFVTEQTDPDDPCAGLTLSLATPLNQDRFVAASDDDTDPGTLIEKLEEGAGINIFVNEDDNAVVIASLGTILADAADTDPLGFLSDKLEGSTVNGITITPVYNPSTKKVTLQLSVDSDLFCAAINDCVPATCVEYSISNSSGVTQQVTWMGCDGSTTIMNLPDGSGVIVCARLNTVEGTGLTVVATGECTTTTTATP